MNLPPGESVTVEYVHGKPWSAFSRYQGNFHSLIQINADFGLTVDQVLQLACHEGYPGHHAYNSLRELQLVREHHLTEFMVQPTFSPQSLASEAAATFAVELAFPEPERTRFERNELFPLAGLDPRNAELYGRVERLVEALHPAEPAIARDYLDGNLEFVRAAWALEAQVLMVHSEATLKYINEYRSYLTAYTLGRDMVAEAVDDQPGRPAAARWQRFAAGDRNVPRRCRLRTMKPRRLYFLVKSRVTRSKNCLSGDRNATQADDGGNLSGFGFGRRGLFEVGATAARGGQRTESKAGHSPRRG